MYIHTAIAFLFLVHPIGYKAPPAHHKPPELKTTAVVKIVPAPAPVPPPSPPPAPAPPLTYPVAPVGTYANTYAFGNCTWYVAGRKKVPDSWGNAADWAANAEAQGVTVSSTPIVGAIAQRTGGLGHVAIVLEFTATMVHITEMNSAGFDVVDDRWMPIATYNYIYI